MVLRIMFSSMDLFTTDATSSLNHAPSHTLSLCLSAILLSSPPFPFNIKWCLTFKIVSLNKRILLRTVLISKVTSIRNLQKVEIGDKNDGSRSDVVAENRPELFDRISKSEKKIVLLVGDVRQAADDRPSRRTRRKILRLLGSSVKPDQCYNAFFVVSISPGACIINLLTAVINSVA